MKRERTCTGSALLRVSQNYVLRHGNRFVRSRLMPKSSAFRHSRIYRRKIRGACPRIFRIFIEIGLRPKSLIDFCNSLKRHVRSRTCLCFFGVLVQICHIGCDLDNALGIGRMVEEFVKKLHRHIGNTVKNYGFVRIFRFTAKVDHF